MDSGQTEESLLYDVLHKMVVCEKLDNFPSESADILLGLLDECHEPQVWLLTCILVGHMCNLTSVARNHLAQRGALSSLTSVLNRSFSSLMSITLFSQKGKLYELLIRFILSLMQHFSLGASICITKMLQCDTLSTILSAVDCNTSALYVYDRAETKVQLDSLIAGRSLVGRRICIPSTPANDVYKCLLGCDVADVLGTDLPFHDSFVVDLYDTNGDEDIHIIEQLTSHNGSGSSVQESSEDFDDLNSDVGEWVDVYVTCVLDGSHFVAVFGAEHVKQFHQLSQNLEAAVANDHFTPLTQLPSRGQLVCVSHPKRGAYRAYVVNADNEKILIFSPDGGYVEELPLSYLKTFDS